MENDSGNESIGEWEWKLGELKVRRGRCAAMYGNEWMSDVCFVVGREGEKRVRIPAHKFILATASPVFYAMFYGPLAEKKEIEIIDIEPCIFHAMLKYLYSDELDIDLKFLPALKKCAGKYLLNGLSQSCLRLLKLSLTQQNALSILEECVLVKENEVASKCLKIIDLVATSVFTWTSFTNINYETLKLILSRDTLTAPENKIFEAALRWAVAKCRRSNLEETGENLRNSLGDALFLIRFPVMTQKDFANLPAKSGLLTKEEICDILLYFAADSKPELKFCSKPRLSLQWRWCSRFSQKRSNFLLLKTIQFSSEHISFSVSDPILVNGFVIFFRPEKKSGSGQYKMELKNSHTVLSVQELEFSWEPDKSKTDQQNWIYFSFMFIAEANTFYTFSICAEPQISLYIRTKGQQSVTVNSVTFNFTRDPNKESSFKNFGDGLFSGIDFIPLEPTK